MMKKILLILTCFLTLGFNSFAQLKFDVNNCQGLYMHQYSTQADSVIWELEEGEATFLQGQNFLSIQESTDGTVLKQLNYYSFRETPIIEYYTINLPYTCTDDIISQETITIENCNFPYTHTPVTVALPKTTEYELESGEVDFTADNGLLIINSASNGAVLVEKITYDNEPSKTYITAYTISVSGCVDIGIDQGQNDNTVNCGDSAPISAIVSSQNKDNYTYVWSTDSEGITINNPNSATTDFTITTAGTKIIVLKVYSQLGNLLGTSRMTFVSNCVDDICIDDAKIKKDAVCPDVYQPVCGCNGITYNNSCSATASGVVSFTEGACATNNVTQAHVGLSAVDVSPCQFSYTHQPETKPKENEISNWKLISGKAGFFKTEDGNLKVSDATDKSTFVYSITNGSQTTYDTLTLIVLDKHNCLDVGIDQGQNDNTVNCGDSAPISAIVSSQNKDNYTYVWSTDSEGITINNPNSATTDFTVTTAGAKIIVLRVYSELGNLLGASNMTFVSTCSDNDDVTQAHVGLDIARVTPCDFRYTHQPETRPTTNETANWELIEGDAEFNFETTGDLTISDATDKSTFVYSITNGSQTTYDTLTLRFNDDGNSCVDVGIDQGQNDNTVNCGDSAPIFAIVSSPDKDNYIYVWSSTSEGITINNPNSTTTDFTITTSGAKIIELKVYSKLGNLLGASNMTFVSTCSDEEKYTIEGHVTAQEEMWQHGMIYLYNVSQEAFVDSVVFERGIYLFKNVTAGTYTLYAVPYEDSSLTKTATNFSSTYYVNKVSLEDANTFEVTDNTFGVDIRLQTKEIISSINNHSNNQNLLVYPNPFSNELFIDLNHNEVEVTVSDIQGNVVYSNVLTESTNLNTSDWAQGIYFVKLKTENNVTTSKLIK
ncbi:MAG: T9SS type A sorting domain-containing protein [Cytophagales bacterium]|nr:T9SS type A sorting domain-containing protein [Cytophagales bacterium]